MSNQNDRFGVNMIKYCKQHEAYIQKQLSGDSDFAKLLDYHNKKIEWLQHERLVHLLVTMLTSVLFLFLFFMALYLNGNILVLVLTLGVLILLLFYLFHYFRLENTVQHWYIISDEIYEKLNKT